MKKNTFWKNKNVFISGVAGFVGSNLAKNVVNNGSNVIGLTQNKKVNSLLYYEKKQKFFYHQDNNIEMLLKLKISFQNLFYCLKFSYF